MLYFELLESLPIWVLINCGFWIELLLGFDLSCILGSGSHTTASIYRVVCLI
jgi:hypothetical protein